jgi:hypothetical protein
MKPRTAVSTIAVILVILTLFQAALILGLPWGRAAWGGRHAILPTGYRLASAGSILIYGLILWVVRRRIVAPEHRGFRTVSWIIFGYFCLGVVLNAMSTSPIERLWTPVNLILAWALFVVARGHKPGHRTHS